MIYQSQLEQQLVEQGYSSFTTDQKNLLIATLANRSGLTFSAITDDYVLSWHKTLKKALIEEDKFSDIATGFTSSNGHRYSVSSDDQVNFLGEKASLDIDPTVTSVDWEQLDVGVWVTHTKDEWLQVFKEAFAYKKNCLMQCNILKSKLDAATTEDAVFAISWVNPGLTTPTPS